MAEVSEHRSPDDLETLCLALGGGTLDLHEYLDQLETRFESQEPKILAFLPERARFRRLRHSADALLARYPLPGNRPPLFGVPVGFKDIVHVEGFTTRAGSALPPATMHGPEAICATLLREAGALVLGKTVTTEFAYFAAGPTRNPENPTHTPGGSSSGSAAAVGGGLCPLAIGTQTVGSVIRPAAFCGVVGFKPSYERIPSDGVLPLAPSVDHVGTFTATTSGLERVAGLLCANWQPPPMLGAPVLAVPDGPYLAHVSTSGRRHFDAMCNTLAASGFTLEHVPAMPDFAAVYSQHRRLVAAEAAQVHGEWFTAHGDRYREQTADLIRRGQQIPEPELVAARAGRLALRDRLQRTMDVSGIDLWISPPATGAAPAGLDSTGDPVMNLPWSHAGMPTITLPAGRNADGLPMGLQMTARWGQDEQLVAWATELEPYLPPDAAWAE